MIPLLFAAISVLEPANGRCEWRLVDPVAKTATVVATFDGDCAGAVMAPDAKGTRALVLFDPSLGGGSYGSKDMEPPFVTKSPSRSAPAALYEVTVKGSRTRALPLPGEIRDFGYDAKGDAFALTLDEVPQTKDPYLTFQGTRYPKKEGGDGLPALAHAWRLHRNAWSLVETVATTWGADYSAGVRELSRAKTLVRHGFDEGALHPSGKTVEDPALLKKLETLCPTCLSDPDHGQWIRLDGIDPPVYDWEVNIEFVWSTGRIAFADGDGVAAPAAIGFTNGDLIAPSYREGWLLVALGDTGYRPRVYDPKTRALLWSSDTALAARFWP